jgi:hypothetical protein
MNNIDLMIIESLLQNENFIKNADSGSLVSTFSNKIKELVESHYDPNDKTGSLTNILGPGVLFATLNALGFTKIGLLVGLLMNVFHIDLNNIIKSIWGKLTPAISSGKQLTSSQIDEFVQSAVSSSIPNLESESSLTDVRILKLAMEEYKTAAPGRSSSFYDALIGRKARAGSILVRILSWVFKIALASAGLLVAGDVINKFLGRPNALDKTMNKGKETPLVQTPTNTFTAKQTKFPLKTGYVPERYDSPWIENIPNNESSIEQMLISFAKNVYSGLEEKDNLIRNSPAFNIVKDRIVWHNHTSPNAPIVYLPEYFTSKKQIVDYFIDDVAEKSQ